MYEGLAFGWRSAVLLVAFLQLLAISVALTRPIQNRTANRTLAALLIILAGIITPWMIGFAGFYDRWQWLSFAPFAIPLTIGPLAYLYIHALVHGVWPERAWRHLLPGVIQFAYLSTAFLVLRQPFKNDWLLKSSLGYDLIAGGGVIAGLACYGFGGRSLIKHYDERLSEQRSDDHRYALVWLGRAVSALFGLLVVWAGYSLADLIHPLGYRGLMGLYLAIAAFALYLAIEGWRHAALPFPRLAELESTLTAASTPEWKVRATDWASRVQAERLYADPELSVPRLANILGTNTAYVSRAFNEGLGVTFSEFINRLRCEEVASRLRDGSSEDLLDLALDSGFSSKASFNRAFRAAFSCTPSSYRRAQVSHSK